MNFQIYDENVFANASSGLVLFSYLLCARSAHHLFFTYQYLPFLVRNIYIGHVLENGKGAPPPCLEGKQEDVLKPILSYWWYFES